MCVCAPRAPCFPQNIKRKTAKASQSQAMVLAPPVARPRSVFDMPYTGDEHAAAVASPQKIILGSQHSMDDACIFDNLSILGTMSESVIGADGLGSTLLTDRLARMEDTLNILVDDIKYLKEENEMLWKRIKLAEDETGVCVPNKALCGCCRGTKKTHPVACLCVCVEEGPDEAGVDSAVGGTTDNTVAIAPFEFFL